MKSSRQWLELASWYGDNAQNRDPSTPLMIAACSFAAWVRNELSNTPAVTHSRNCQCAECRPIEYYEYSGKQAE